MADLGSAAVGTAGALSSVVGHSFHKDKKRRAASARPARKGRSRSPGDEPEKGHAVTVERGAKAPIFIDPGHTPDGVKSNAERVFAYLANTCRRVYYGGPVCEYMPNTRCMFGVWWEPKVDPPHCKLLTTAAQAPRTLAHLPLLVQDGCAMTCPYEQRDAQ